MSIFGNDYATTPDGTCQRDFIHVVDLAEGHVAALAYGENHTGCHIFNLGTGVPRSVLEIVNAFQDINGVMVPYSFAERRAGDFLHFGQIALSQRKN